MSGERLLLNHNSLAGCELQVSPPARPQSPEGRSSGDKIGRDPEL